MTLRLDLAILALMALLRLRNFRRLRRVEQDVQKIKIHLGLDTSCKTMLHIGQKVTVKNMGSNAVIIKDIGNYALVESDEWIPYLGKPNPRRRQWVHKTHIEV